MNAAELITFAMIALSSKSNPTLGSCVPSTTVPAADATYTGAKPLQTGGANMTSSALDVLAGHFE